jgi:hypothetical protein
MTLVLRREAVGVGLLAAAAAGVALWRLSGGRDHGFESARNLDSRGLALRGYDPVAYFSGRPTAGRAELTAIHDGATYRFASAENRAAFVAEPTRFLPAYGGFCAWAAAQGYKADADPEAYTVVGDRLFLNYDRKVQADWAEDVPGNIAKADANWPAIRDRAP